MSKKDLTCPNCRKKLKSSSGYTLHIKKCCPEMRFLQTRIRMTIEFTVPRPVTDSPAAAFNDAFGSYEREGGRAMLRVAEIHDHDVTPRPPTKYEQEKLDKADAMKDKGAAGRELKKMLGIAIDDASWSLSVSTRGWPENIDITAYPAVAGKSAIAGRSLGRPVIVNAAYDRRVEFRFHLEKQKMKIHRPHGNKKREITLADPNLFPVIKSFMSLPGSLPLP